MRLSNRIFAAFLMLSIFLLLFSCSRSSENKEAPNINFTDLPPPAKAYSHLAAAPVTVQNETNVLVISLTSDNSSQISLQGLLSGLNAILIYDTHTSALVQVEDPNVPHIHYVLNKRVLSLLENVHQGYIDYLDNSFPHLKLLIFQNNGKSYIIVPAYQAGIRAIFYNAQSLNQSHTINTSDFSNNPNQVIMSDGSKRALGTLAVPDSYLGGAVSIDKVIAQ